MTLVETAKLLTIIQASYSRFEVEEPKIALWYDMLEDIPYQVAQTAVKKHILTNTFPPVIAEIRAAAGELATPEEYFFSAEEAWSQLTHLYDNLKRFKKRGMYEYIGVKTLYSDEEEVSEEDHKIKSYEDIIVNLYPITRKIVQENILELDEWADLGEKTKKEFIHVYKEFQAKEREKRSLPKAFQNTYNRLRQQLTNGEVRLLENENQKILLEVEAKSIKRKLENKQSEIDRVQNDIKSVSGWCEEITETEKELKELILSHPGNINKVDPSKLTKDGLECIIKSREDYQYIFKTEKVSPELCSYLSKYFKLKQKRNTLKGYQTEMEDINNQYEELMKQLEDVQIKISDIRTYGSKLLIENV